MYSSILLLAFREIQQQYDSNDSLGQGIAVLIKKEVLSRLHSNAFFS
jgi:hypothetical protein